MRVLLGLMIIGLMTAPALMADPSSAHSGGHSYALFYVADSVGAGLEGSTIPGVIGRDYVAGVLGLCPGSPTNLAMADQDVHHASEWRITLQDRYGADTRGLACFYDDGDLTCSHGIRDRESITFTHCPADRMQFWIYLVSTNIGVGTVGQIEIQG